MLYLNKPLQSFQLHNPFKPDVSLLPADLVAPPLTLGRYEWILLSLLRISSAATVNWRWLISPDSTFCCQLHFFISVTLLIWADMKLLVSLKEKGTNRRHCLPFIKMVPFFQFNSLQSKDLLNLIMLQNLVCNMTSGVLLSGSCFIALLSSLGLERLKQQFPEYVPMFEITVMCSMSRRMHFLSSSSWEKEIPSCVWLYAYVHTSYLMLEQMAEGLWSLPSLSALHLWFSSHLDFAHWAEASLEVSTPCWRVPPCPTTNPLFQSFGTSRLFKKHFF